MDVVKAFFTYLQSSYLSVTTKEYILGILKYILNKNLETIFVIFCKVKGSEFPLKNILH